MGKSRKPPRPKNDYIRLAFEIEPVTLDVSQIFPLKLFTKELRKSYDYKQILASIKAVGIIEPLIVAPDKRQKDQYMLLDGLFRLEALKELGITEVTCLVSTDDESFTYNKHINHLSAIQEYRMILKAVERGVSEQKIADALNMEISSIQRKKSMLDGICPEVVDLLKEKMVPETVFYILKRMGSLRQIEAAMLMIDSNVYTLPYAKALLAATLKDQLKDPDKPKKIKGLTDEQITRMENEMSNVQHDFKLIEETYNVDVMNLVLAKGYLRHLLDNGKVVRYLAQNHPEFLPHFQKITEMTSLNDKGAASD